MSDLPCNCTDTAFCERHLPRSRSGEALAPRLSPEERAVIEAAKLCVAHNYPPEPICDAVRWGALKLAVEALQEVKR